MPQEQGTPFSQDFSQFWLVGARANLQNMERVGPLHRLLSKVLSLLHLLYNNPLYNPLNNNPFITIG
jgi:hypothetical protein